MPNKQSSNSLLHLLPKKRKKKCETKTHSNLKATISVYDDNLSEKKSQHNIVKKKIKQKKRKPNN